ncbi:MAG: phosphodiesterase [Clostridia bacterium]|nr:phosphodiesterase [Clostridia bacterium]
MKLLIASDVHGSAKYCRLLLDALNREGADKLVLLGDILYHGPRNDLPEQYAPKEVIAMLSEVSDKIICVRGNCEADIDLEVLPFGISDNSLLFIDGLNIHLAHGHKCEPVLNKGDVYITGHTHVPLKEEKEYYHLNPGSVSIPKEDSAHSYILYENRKFVYKNLDGEEYDSLQISGAKVTPSSAVVRRNPVLHRKVVRRYR